jgi:hypothetical protein
MNRTPKDIEDLDHAMLDIPEHWRRHLLPYFDKVKETSIRRKRILDTLASILEDLKVDVAYMRLDLEATRRERDALK